IADIGLDDRSLEGAERRMIIQPTSLEDPTLNKLKEAVVEWINKTLKIKHIVVRTLEEDLYDGLSVHVLIPGRVAGVQLHIEEIALSTDAQVRKLEVILTALNETLGLNEETYMSTVLQPCHLSVIHSRDLLATMHLLVVMARHFQPDLVLPVNVSVDVIQCEVTKSGIKADRIHHISKECPIDELFQTSSLGLNVTDLDKQFADGEILLLLIGQLEGFFISLCEFFLCPVGSSEMLHNVTLALDLLIDRGLLIQSVDPQNIVSQDVPATVKVLYYLFKRHKNK
uniref:Parvin, gamma n=1 Tax=Sinocyclocheilus rhinocerous TaxID=307959 RepID=A0A673IZZ6_9TELE